MFPQFVNIASGSDYYYESPYTLSNGSHKLLNYMSIKQLYYSNFNTSSGVIDTTGSYDNYLETSLFSGSRKLNNNGEGIIYSIPRKLFGVNLEPNTLVLSSSYSSAYKDGCVISDDGEGNLISGSTHVGNVIYAHGQVIVTDQTCFYHLSASEADSTQPTISFKSNLPIVTRTYSIKVSDYEFNHTLNPTAQTGNTVLTYSGSNYLQPSGQYSNNITGSDFQPYITSVGLYNDSNELLIVGKLAQPLPKPADTELTIQLKLDV